MFFSFYFSLLRLPVLRNDSADFKEPKQEQLLTAESSHTEGSTSETRITDTTDSGTCDLEDTSLNSEMFRRKSQGADSVSNGQRTKQTTASRRADSTQPAGNESKSLSSAPVTKTKKVSVKSIEVKAPSDATSQRLPDQNDGGHSSATSPKSKIPLRSASGAEVKSPVAPDKAVAHVSGTVVTLKSQKTAESKDFLKPVNGQSADRAKAEKTREIREASPTKTATKTGTKHIKEKSEVDSHPVNLVNGVVNDRAEATVKTTHPAVKKDAQKNLDIGDASSTPSSRLPVSVQARKKNQEITEASRTDCSAVTETEAERSEAAQKQSADRGEGSLGVTATKDASPKPHESPKKGKDNTLCHHSLNHLLQLLIMIRHSVERGTI